MRPNSVQHSSAVRGLGSSIKAHMDRMNAFGNRTCSTVLCWRCHRFRATWVWKLGPLGSFGRHPSTTSGRHSHLRLAAGIVILAALAATAAARTSKVSKQVLSVTVLYRNCLSLRIPVAESRTSLSSSWRLLPQAKPYSIAYGFRPFPPPIPMV